MRHTLLAASLVLLSSQLQAQDVPANAAGPGVPTTGTEPGQEPDNTIIVSGTREEIRDELGSILSESSKQLARFERPFCPFIVGFGEELTPLLRERLNENAKSAGLELAKTPCEPTALVIFIDEPQELAKALRKKYPRILGENSIYRRDKITGPARPYYAWQITRLLGRQGEQPGTTSGEAGALGTDLAVATTRGGHASRLSSRYIKDIETAFLLIDVDEVEGMALSQIADFASLKLLLQMRPEAHESARQDSLLRLFDVEDPGTLPLEMSAFDRRMLEGLYGLSDNAVRGSVQRGRIASYIKRAKAEDMASEEGAGGDR